jgi:hypothetical protein
MKVSELKKIFPYLMQAQVPALLIGHHGVGKSSVARQLAESHGMELFDVRLGTMADAGDLLGLMHEGTDEHGNKFFHHSLPSWWPKKGEKKLIFIDELNRARPDMLQMVFQLILDRRIHTHVLPEGCYVMSAINPDTDDYKTTNIDDAALLSRFCQIKFQPSQEEFQDYFRSTQPDPTFFGFIAENMNEVDSTGLQGFELKAKPDRRAVVRVNQLIQAGLPEEFWIETIGGMLGYEMSVKYHTYFKNNRLKPLTGEQVLDEYNKHSHVIAEMLKKERHDTITVSVDNVLAEVLKTPKLTKKESLNLRSFLLDIPRDIAQGFTDRFVSDCSKTNKDTIRMVNEYVLDEDFIEHFTNKLA